MNSKYFLFVIKIIKEVADALEDGKISAEEIQNFVLFIITEVPKLFKKD